MKNSNKKRYCYIHIGTHKTGSTSIQKALTQASAGKNPEEIGFLYPFSGNISTSVRSHHNIAYELICDPAFKSRYGTLLTLKEELSAFKTGSVILSSEIFELMHSNVSAMYKLKALLNAASLETVVVVFFRNQADYVNSLYKELVNHGLKVSPESFAESILQSSRFVYGKRCYSEEFNKK